MNIVVTNLKGGVGKTTTAVYLSAVAGARGYDPVVLIDADRQASAAEWLEERPIEGVTVVEAPSERTLTRAMGKHDGMGIVDTPPGDEGLVQSAIDSADAVVIPTRAGGVEFPRVAATLEMIPARTPRGVVISAARLGTNDLEEAIAWWRAEKLPAGPGRVRRRAAARAPSFLELRVEVDRDDAPVGVAQRIGVRHVGLRAGRLVLRLGAGGFLAQALLRALLQYRLLAVPLRHRLLPLRRHPLKHSCRPARTLPA